MAVAMLKKCTPLLREARVEVKMYKALQVRSTFGSCDVEKVHAVVARNTFGSENAQNTPCSDHSWKLRCPKSASAVVARSTFGSENEQTPDARTTFGPPDVVHWSKKCTPLWCEAHLQVKGVKKWEF